MTKLDWNDLRGKEILLWSILLFNLVMFFFNVFEGDMVCLLNIIAVGLMIYSIEMYYKLER